MADVRAFRSGNWSDTTATSPWWNGTEIFAPAAGDNVYSNNFTIAVDISATCTSITNLGATSRVWKDGGTATATAGGGYTLSNGITLTANLNSGHTGLSLVTISGTASASIVGNVSNANQAGSGAVAISCSTNGTLTITGNITGGGSSSTGLGVTNTSTGTINVTGNVLGQAAVGLNNNSTGTISVTGNVTAGSGAAGANNASTGTFIIVGDITAVNGGNGFTSSNSAASNRLSGSFINSVNGTAAIYAAKYILNTTPLAAKTRYALDGAGAYVDFFTADNSLGQAIPADVRLGTVYASGSLTGTLAVPAVGSVALGVPVDATVGTAVLTASAIRTELTPELTQISETHLIHGLQTGSPLNVTPTSRTAGAISQTITGDGVTTTTVTR